MGILKRIPPESIKGFDMKMLYFCNKLKKKKREKSTNLQV